MLPDSWKFRFQWLIEFDRPGVVRSHALHTALMILFEFLK